MSDRNVEWRSISSCESGERGSHIAAAEERNTRDSLEGRGGDYAWSRIGNADDCHDNSVR